MQPESFTDRWLTHRLASLHDAANQQVFDSVIVVSAGRAEPERS
jgi:hypothetical protein